MSSQVRGRPVAGVGFPNLVPIDGDNTHVRTGWITQTTIGTAGTVNGIISGLIPPIFFSTFAVLSRSVGMTFRSLSARSRAYAEKPKNAIFTRPPKRQNKTCKSLI